MPITNPTIFYGTLGFFAITTIVLFFACQLTVPQVKTIKVLWRKLTTRAAYRQKLHDFFKVLETFTRGKKSNKKTVVSKRKRRAGVALLMPFSSYKSSPYGSLGQTTPRKLRRFRPSTTRRMSEFIGVVGDKDIWMKKGPNSDGKECNPVERKLTAPSTVCPSVGETLLSRKTSMPVFSVCGSYCQERKVGTCYKDWSERLIIQEAGHKK